MPMFKQRFFLIFTLINLAFSNLAIAEDLALEQASVTDARREYDNAQSAYEDATNKINDLEKLIAQEKTLLKEQQEKQVAAKNRFEIAKVHLDKKQKDLERVWKENEK